MLDHPRVSPHALRLLNMLPQHPIVTVARAVTMLATTKPTATRAVAMLVDHGILDETTGRRRDRPFVYRSYLDRLREGTELEG
jgi:Fic family protein